jgi:4-amino-4-deoxy-L-arabinose transferase-like glycosyltransferase
MIVRIFANALTNSAPMIRAFRQLASSLLVIVLVAFVARLTFAWYQTRQIPTQVLRTVPFQTETGHIAYSAAAGKGFSSPYERDSGPTAILPPVYPLIVAALFKIFGSYSIAAYFAAIFFNIIFSTATCVPIYYATKRIAGAGIASLAAWLWALFITAIRMPTEWIWDTSLSALLVATIVWATLELPTSRRWRDWSAYGLLWGLVLMTNPAPASVLPFLLAWLIYGVTKRDTQHSRRTSELAKPLLAVALALLCCVPWTVRNYVVFHRFIPLRSGLPFELYIGNNENYDERQSGLPPAITFEREVLRYLKMGETPFMDEEKRKALAFIATHPRVELTLFAKRFVAFWIGTAQPLQTFIENDSLLLRAILLGNFLTAIGGAFGIAILSIRRNPYAFPLAAFPLIFPIIYYVTHTSLRYRHALDPIVLLLTAIAVGAPLRFLSPNSPTQP